MRPEPLGIIRSQQAAVYSIWPLRRAGSFLLKLFGFFVERQATLPIFRI